MPIRVVMQGKPHQATKLPVLKGDAVRGGHDSSKREHFFFVLVNHLFNVEALEEVFERFP